MKSSFELMIEQHAAQFKSEVNTGMQQVFYADITDAQIETIDLVQCFEWGFYYEFDGLPCAVIYASDGLQDHSDVALNEQSGIDTFHGHALHPTIDSLIAGLLAGQLEGIGELDEKQEQMLFDLRMADKGMFVPGDSETN